jgi:hypothetical protein
VSWPRRIGVVLGLTLLGASIVLAGQVLVRGGIGDASGAPPAGPPPAPALVPIATNPTSADAIEVAGSSPAGLHTDGSYQLRIYVNDVLARQRNLPVSIEWTVRDVPLVEGSNAITAAIFGPGGEGLHSAPVTVVRDSQPPPLHLISPPGDEQTIDAAMTIVAETDPGASVNLANRLTGEEQALTVDPAGHFTASVALELGANAIVLTASDELGNRASIKVTVERVKSRASVSLSADPTTISASDLPTTMDLAAQILDPLGEPADGAQVVFSISPPGQPTATYATTSSAGVARWDDVRLTGAGQETGRGQVTVLVTLADGQQLTNSLSFSVR